MNKFLFILFILLSIPTALSQSNVNFDDPVVPVAGPVICTNEATHNAGLCATHESKRGIGGLRVVDTIADRDAINALYRTDDLWVIVRDDGTGTARGYVFPNNLNKTNSDWVEDPLSSAMLRIADGVTNTTFNSHVADYNSTKTLPPIDPVGSHLFSATDAQRIVLTSGNGQTLTFPDGGLTAGDVITVVADEDFTGSVNWDTEQGVVVNDYHTLTTPGQVAQYIVTSNTSVYRALSTTGAGGVANYQTIDVFSLTGSILNLSLSNDGQATQTLDLSSLGVGTDPVFNSVTVTGNTSLDYVAAIDLDVANLNADNLTVSTGYTQLGSLESNDHLVDGSTTINENLNVLGEFRGPGAYRGICTSAQANTILGRGESCKIDGVDSLAFRGETTVWSIPLIFRSGADVTNPAAPTAFTAVAGDNQVTLSWAEAADPDLAFTKIYRSIGTCADTNPTTLIQSVSQGIETFNDLAVFNTATYCYAASSIDDAGNESALTAEQEASPVADGTAPTISNYAVANPSGQNVTATFGTDEALADISIAVTGAETATLTEANCDPLSGIVVCTHAGATDGSYTLTLNVAADASGNNGASANSGSVTVGATNLVFEDQLLESENGLIDTHQPNLKPSGTASVWSAVAGDPAVLNVLGNQGAAAGASLGASGFFDFVNLSTDWVVEAYHDGDAANTAYENSICVGGSPGSETTGGVCMMFHGSELRLGTTLNGSELGSTAISPVLDGSTNGPNYLVRLESDGTDVTTSIFAAADLVTPVATLTGALPSLTGAGLYLRAENVDARWYGPVRVYASSAGVPQDVTDDFVADNFDETDNTALTASATEVGGTWTIHPSSTGAGTDYFITSNELGYNTGLTDPLPNPIIAYVNTPAPSPNYSVTADLHIVTNTAGDAHAGVMGRVNASTETGYYTRWTNGIWELFKTVSGTYTSLGTYAEAISNGATRTLTLDMNDDTIRLLVDGVERISATDASITEAGYAAIAVDGETGEDFRLNNFKAEVNAFAYDDFDGADGTVFLASVLETGTGWKTHPNSLDDGTQYQIKSNQMGHISDINPDTYLAYVTDDPISPDYSVSATLNVVIDGNSGHMGVVGRWSPTSNSGYYLRWTNDVWTLFSAVDGSFTSLGTYNDVLANGSTRTLKLDMSGTTIRGFINGVERISVTNSDHTTAGKVGVRMDGYTGADLRLNNFIAE